MISKVLSIIKFFKINLPEEDSFELASAKIFKTLPRFRLNKVGTIGVSIYSKEFKTSDGGELVPAGGALQLDFHPLLQALLVEVVVAGGHHCSDLLLQGHFQALPQAVVDVCWGHLEQVHQADRTLGLPVLFGQF